MRCGDACCCCITWERERIVAVVVVDVVAYDTRVFFKRKGNADK